MSPTRQCLTTTALLVLTCVPAPAQNLLSNPSFEQSERRNNQLVPAGWETWTYEGTRLSWAQGQGRGGSAAGCIEVATSGAGQFPLFCQRFQVQAGQHYRARIWARTEDVVSSWGPQLNFEFQDAQGHRLPFVEGGQAGGGTHDWVELSGECFVPADAVQMLLTVYTHRDGKVWVDDAELVLVCTADTFDGSAVQVHVHSDRLVNADFLGFGNHGDWFLGCEMNTRRGVSETDRQRLRKRVADMRPKIVRVLFDYKWWEPVKGERSVDNPRPARFDSVDFLPAVNRL